MERSVASLTFKGSVSDAIAQAQREKKLFLVYVSGDDEISELLEQKTLVHESVAACISKYCILLHLKQGSIDALQFSAIYPQERIPCITAVGYNGVMSWQHEGFISSEDFVENIEKAWAALHLQDTTVALLTAALATKKHEPLSSDSQQVQGNTSALDVASPSSGNSTEYLGSAPSDGSKLLVEKIVPELTDDKKGTEPVGETSRLSTSDDVKTEKEEQPRSGNIREDVLETVTQSVHSPTCGDDAPAAMEETLAFEKNHGEASPVSVIKSTVSGTPSSQLPVTRESEQVVEPTNTANSIKSEDIFLNIRLPNGVNLQRKFTVRDTLKYVKNYVDENQVDGIGSYDLAVPYPRRVFSEQDMNSVLSELGFAGRQALIVVPHSKTVRPQSGMSSARHSEESMDSSDDNNGGYFGFVRKVLSYMNPLSYLGGSPRPADPAAEQSQTYRQYRPSDALQSRVFSGSEASNRPSGVNQQNPSPGDNNAGEARRRASRPFGSNIHTLRHDEDEFTSRDRNTFWNGNSTQFGGGEDKK